MSQTIEKIHNRTGTHHTAETKLKISQGNKQNQSSLIGSISFPKNTEICKLSWRESINNLPARQRYKSFSYGSRSTCCRAEALAKLEAFQIENTKRLLALRN